MPKREPIPEPKVGEKLWHISHEYRGKVLAIIRDPEAHDVFIVRFWFRRKQRWHYEVEPMWMWVQGHSNLHRDDTRPDWHKERYARKKAS